MRCQSCSGYHRFPPLDDTSIDGPTTAPSFCLVRSLLDGGGTHFAQPGVTVVDWGRGKPWRLRHNSMDVRRRLSTNATSDMTHCFAWKIVKAQELHRKNRVQVEIWRPLTMYVDRTWRFANHSNAMYGCSVMNDGWYAAKWMLIEG